jgi:hypothetical protein
VASASRISVVCQLPADLTRVVEAWERLPEAIRRAMLTLVGAAGKMT